jgi:hypothetical protein
MVFAFFATDQRRRTDWLLVLAAAVFLVMTHSKSSMGLLVPSLAAWVVYRLAEKGPNSQHHNRRRFAPQHLATAYCRRLGCNRGLFQTEEFMGRTAIWVELHFCPIIRCSAGASVHSPTRGYSRRTTMSTPVEQISYSHNGYLQVLMETGTALCRFAFVAPPGGIWRREAIPLPFKAFFSQCLLLATTPESDFCRGRAGLWRSC